MLRRPTVFAVQDFRKIAAFISYSSSTGNGCVFDAFKSSRRDMVVFHTFKGSVVYFLRVNIRASLGVGP